MREERAGVRTGRGGMRLRDERWRRSKSVAEMDDGPESERARKVRIDGEREQGTTRRLRDRLGKQEAGEQRREGVDEE